jgi:hypothetical protein
MIPQISGRSRNRVAVVIETEFHRLQVEGPSHAVRVILGVDYG